MTALRRPLTRYLPAHDGSLLACTLLPGGLLHLALTSRRRAPTRAARLNGTITREVPELRGPHGRPTVVHLHPNGTLRVHEAGLREAVTVRLADEAMLCRPAPNVLALWWREKLAAAGLHTNALRWRRAK